MSNKYSDETRAAVLAALLTGQSVSAVAKEYKIPTGTVKSWKSREITNADAVPVATQKKEQIGELLLSYLHQNLETLRQQAKVFGDEDWLKKQHASDAAVLHGVMADKTIRLLEALSASKSND
jgi:transposase-like protein